MTDICMLYCDLRGGRRVLWYNKCVVCRLYPKGELGVRRADRRPYRGIYSGGAILLRPYERGKATRFLTTAACGGLRSTPDCRTLVQLRIAVWIGVTPDATRISV